MKYLKKTCRPKAANNVHNNEGVRVNDKTGKDPKAATPDAAETRSKVLTVVVKTATKEAVRWGIQNWPFVQEHASKMIEAFVELFNL